MWSIRRSRLFLGSLAAAAVVCAALLATARQSVPPTGPWNACSGGLGLGSSSEIGAGFFGFDRRLESADDGLFSPLVGQPFQHFAGTLDLRAPPARD